MKLTLTVLILLIASYSFFGTAIEPNVRLENPSNGVYELTITPRYTLELIAARNNWNEIAEATCVSGKYQVEYVNFNLPIEGDSYEKAPESGELVAEVLPATFYGAFTCVSD